MKEGKKPQYDRRCRERQDIDPKATHVIRAKIPLEGYIEFNDLIRGPIRVENAEIDDFVLIRSNGAPTYNLSVVVDDVHSRMTHIIRGDDHINNTPKQMHLYRFLEYPVPQFAHLPMILGADKKKLSKRHGAVSANLYRQEGYLPEALLNFLVRLGWSHGDQEVFTMDELVKFFDFDHVQKSSAVFNLEKLQWLNGAHIRQTTPERLQKIVLEDFATLFALPALERARGALARELVALIQPKVKLVKELAEQLVPLCTPGVVDVNPSELKWNKDPELKKRTQAAVAEALASWSERVASKSASRADAAWGQAAALRDVGIGHTEIEAELRTLSEKHGVKLGDLAQPLRLCVTGRMVSAGLFDLLALLPWDVAEPRLKQVATL